MEGFKVTEVLPVIHREAKVRNFDFQVVFNAFLNSLNPLKFVSFTISWIWYLAVALTLKMPILILRELKALKSSHKHYYPDTLTSMLYCYLPLIFKVKLKL